MRSAWYVLISKRHGTFLAFSSNKPFLQSESGLCAYLLSQHLLSGFIVYSWIPRRKTMEKVQFSLTSQFWKLKHKAAVQQNTAVFLGLV